MAESVEFGVPLHNPNDAKVDIIFVHCLGGLVFAIAVSRPPGVNETAQKLTENTMGMIFLGTPFAGSDKASWGEMATKFITLFDFDTFIKARDRDRKQGPVEIVCYYEAEPTYAGPKNIGKIINKESAARLSAIAALSIPDNHTDMLSTQNSQNASTESPNESPEEEIGENFTLAPKTTEIPTDIHYPQLPKPRETSEEDLTPAMPEGFGPEDPDPLAERLAQQMAWSALGLLNGQRKAQGTQNSQNTAQGAQNSQNTAPRVSQISSDFSETNIIHGKRTRKARPAHSAMYTTFLTSQKQEIENPTKSYRNDLPTEPANWKKVLSHPHKEEWIAAVKIEYTEMERRGTFEVVKRYRPTRGGTNSTPDMGL
ncbi:hypothetical protein M501DRAFT_1016567 [Patellaria atrata CBS 101060]|uniref:Uncharacterized protein n=1 Tax=Patellaria atrata CBS 101060 TaxID=1346257 RepID=A0A9P4VR47_9PEZI|nr:hypothetical protein M501DRAFT_1016567 [Patellaria atrata CBS 101060]